jgi:hypothetical protein
MRPMTHAVLGGPMRLLGKVLERDHMRALGFDRTSRLARWYNALAHGSALRYRRSQYESGFAELLSENGFAGGSRIEVEDGLARDDSGSLPHLGRLLEEMTEVIAERGGRNWNAHRPFLQDILGSDGVIRYPSLLAFATSSEAIAPIARHFGYIPHLSQENFPPPVRVMESTTKFDPQPEGPYRSSQLWHRDYHSTPTFYVIVLLRETTPESGPLHYLSKSTSDRVAAAMRYGSRRCPHRVPDDVMDSLVDHEEVMTLCGPPGTVLFIDSSKCFHFGSRNAVKPRYQVQYSFISPVRNDFGDLIHERRSLPVRSGDSRLRRMVLERATTEA